MQQKVSIPHLSQASLSSTTSTCGASKQKVTACNAGSSRNRSATSRMPIPPSETKEEEEIENGEGD